MPVASELICSIPENKMQECLSARISFYLTPLRSRLWANLEAFLLDSAFSNAIDQIYLTSLMKLVQFQDVFSIMAYEQNVLIISKFTQNQK